MINIKITLNFSIFQNFLSWQIMEIPWKAYFKFRKVIIFNKVKKCEVESHEGV